MPSEILREWGHNIKTGRVALGLTQEALADLVGVKQPTITRWESGTRRIDDEFKVQLAIALHQDVRQLFPLTRPVPA